MLALDRGHRDANPYVPEACGCTSKEPGANAGVLQKAVELPTRKVSDEKRSCVPGYFLAPVSGFPFGLVTVECYLPRWS